MCWRRAVVPAAFVIFCNASALTAQDAPAATARRITAPIHLDGRLTESDWESAPSIGPLTQREPVEGRPASEPTDVRVLFDDDFIYVGLVCHEIHPRGIISTQLTRDANLDVDDRVTIVFDPFFDHRNGFFFQVNPVGARSDGQISNNAQSLTRDWDGYGMRRSRDRAMSGRPRLRFRSRRFGSALTRRSGDSASNDRSSISSRPIAGPLHESRAGLAIWPTPGSS